MSQASSRRASPTVDLAIIPQEANVFRQMDVAMTSATGASTEGRDRAIGNLCKARAIAAPFRQGGDRDVPKPGCGRPAGFQQNPGTDLKDLGCIHRDRDEVGRGDEAAVAVPPS